MVHSIFRNQDKKHLDAVFQAAVIFFPLPQTLFLQLGTNVILPPTWLDTLTIELIHDDGTTRVACYAAYDGHRSSPSGFRLTPQDPEADLHALFAARSDSFYLAVGQVEIVTAEGNRKTLANQTSLKALQNRPDSEEDFCADVFSADINPQSPGK